MGGRRGKEGKEGQERGRQGKEGEGKEGEGRGMCQEVACRSLLQRMERGYTAYAPLHQSELLNDYSMARDLNSELCVNQCPEGARNKIAASWVFGQSRVLL